MIGLLEFSVANYRSIYSRRTFSMMASAETKTLPENVISNGKIRHLRSCAIYGANSSGKSNLITAMGYMRTLVVDSVKLNDGDLLPFDPFALSTTSLSKPTLFEACFFVNEKKYRYGFEYNDTTILSEWLFSSKLNSKTEKALFVRNTEGIAVNENAFHEGVGLEGRTKENRLFLSLVAQLAEGSEAVSKDVMSFFFKFNVISGIDNSGYEDVTKRYFVNMTKETKKLTSIFKELQLGFDAVFAEEKPVISIFTQHRVYTKNGKVKNKLLFPLEDRESAGTQKLFVLAGPIVNTLMEGKVLVIDELDAKAHPLISQYLVGLFNNPEHNPNHAQLIFSTHDTHLLSSAFLRRDQVWFTEKNEKEETDLYSMTEVLLPDGTLPRYDTGASKDYIMGRYGGIPYIMNN